MLHKRFFYVVLVCISLLVGMPGFAKKNTTYTIDSALSQVSFATIKKQYVVEPATLSGVSGTLDATGKLVATIDLKTIETAIGVRNQRLQDLFFKVANNPNIEVSAQLDMKQVKKRGPVKALSTDITVSFYGQQKKYKADLLVIKSTAKRLVFTTTQPIVVNMADFGIPQANLTALAQTVGGIAISGTVPVNVVLVLKQ